jgi:putative ABC transport system substrate-binding protein
MRRRDFIATLGGAAAWLLWPLAARAQPAVPVIGFLSGGSPGPFTAYVAAFRQGLGETGFVEGRNIAIEFRWAEGQPERLAAMAADLVVRKVALIAATGGTTPALAAKAATTTIPIVVTAGGDPVGAGLVASLSRPGGNVTGTALLIAAMEGKRFGLLRELVPGAGLIAVLLDPNNTPVATQLKDIEDAARTVGQKIKILHARTESELDVAFAALAQVRADALLVAASPFFNNRRARIVALAARQAIPAIYPLREFALAGGLMSYGTDIADSYRQAGLYAGRILKGEKPGELPVVQSTKFEFVINLKTARTLGLEVPPLMLPRADEVIE